LQVAGCAWAPTPKPIDAKVASTVVETDTLKSVHVRPGNQSLAGFPIPEADDGRGWQFMLRGERGLTFRSDEETSPFLPARNGMIKRRSDHPNESFVWIAVDHTVMPGETLAVDYEVRPMSNPKQVMHWRRLVIVVDEHYVPDPVLVGGMPSKGQFALHGGRPNPFSLATTISFYLPADARITLRIYDSKGRAVVTLLNEWRAPGGHVMSWDGTDHSGRSLPSGVYFARLRKENLWQTQKLVLVR